MAIKFKNSVEVDGYLSISSGNWIQVPDGTTAQRPGSPQVGMFRYNTTTAEFEGYFGSPAAWGAIGGGGGGGTVTEAFKTFAVSGQSDIVADGPTDTLTVAAGANISLTTNATTDTLTIASTASGGGTVTVQRNNYTGDGTTVAYSVSSTVISENNIQIYLDGVYQDKTGFTASGTTITFGTAPPTTTAIEIMHYVAVDGVVEVDEFVGDGTTTNFATTLSIINENATQVYVSGVYQSKLTYGTTGNVVSFSTAPPNGANIEVVHIKALALSGFNKNNFVGTGSQTAFTLNTTVTEENMTFVFLEGIYQDKSTYGISGTTLTFATAPQNGYNVEVMVLGAISASTNALYTDTFTGDGTETDYTLGITPVDLNAIEVYLNGLYQNVGTLTLAANVVTFATAPPSGVIIEIRSVGFLNSGGTLAPATLIGGTGISVVTNSPNNFTISNTLIDVSVSFNAPTGQSLTYTTPAGSSGQAGSIFTTTTFTVTKAGSVLSGTAVITGLPAGLTSSQSYNNNSVGNILTITLSGVYPSTNSVGTNLVISGLTTSLPITVDYLVVAGGGGGGASVTDTWNAGGGGAGGLRTSYGTTSGGGSSAENSLTITPLINYTLTVGAGGAFGSGAGNTSNSQPGSNGVNSTFSTITSAGGGGGGPAKNSTGGNPRAFGLNGGSGGGAGVDYTAAAQNGGNGTTNQGYAGGTGANSGSGYGACGGGAGGVGASNVGGYTAAGNPLTVAITNTSVNYSTGGGTGYAGTPPAGVSNSGNGGDSAKIPGGTASINSANGGSGIVILRYPNSKTITNPGSGLTFTTATVGSDNITTFTSGTGNIQFN
jgi:hypothetical protein